MLPVVASPTRVATEIVVYSWLTVAASLALWPLATGWVYGVLASRRRGRAARRRAPAAARDPARRRRPSRCSSSTCRTATSRSCSSRSRSTRSCADAFVRSVLLATCAEFPDGDEDAAPCGPRCAAFDVDAAVGGVGRPGRRLERRAGDPALDLGLPAAPRPVPRPGPRRVPVLHNPAEIVRWNSDKVYLHELATAGVPTTPTAVVPPGAAAEFPLDTEFVVKPSVGAGSRGVGRFRAGDGRARRRSMCAHCTTAGLTALVQPYLAGVDDAGETALMYVAGRFSHAIRKGPMLPDGAAPRHRAPRPACSCPSTSARARRQRRRSRWATWPWRFVRERFGIGAAVRARRRAADSVRAGRDRAGTRRAVAVPVLRRPARPTGSRPRSPRSHDHRARAAAERRTVACPAPDEGHRRRAARPRGDRLRRVPDGRRRQRGVGLHRSRGRGVDGRWTGRLVRGDRAVPASVAAADPAHRDHPAQEGSDRRGAGRVRPGLLPDQRDRRGAGRRGSRAAAGGGMAGRPRARQAGGRGAQQCGERAGRDAARQRAARRRRRVRRQAAA